MKRFLFAFAAFALTMPALVPSHPVIAEPSRHLDYHVDFGLDGVAKPMTVHVDFVSSQGAGAETFDLADDDAPPVRAIIDRAGSIKTAGSASLSEADLALLVAFTLQAENVNGVEVGDQWVRYTYIPGGQSAARYHVTANDGNGIVNMNVSRTIQRDAGDGSIWTGNMVYDANAFIPKMIALSGRVRNVDAGGTHQHSAQIKLELQNDSFAKH